MNRTFYTLFLATTIVAVFASGALAAGKPNDAVRDAQQRLANLGYFSGPSDGLLGVQTIAALREFQLRNGLQANGRLNADTAYLLQRSAAVGEYYYAQPSAQGGGYGMAAYRYENVQPAGLAAWTPQGRTVWSQGVPSRFATVQVNEDRYSNRSNYTVTVNGRAVLLANGQPAPLKLSKTYRLEAADAVVITSVDGTAGCAYRNYLLTVRSDGSYEAPREIGNCSASYQAHVEGGQLVVNFPTGQYATRATMWDRWVASGEGVARM